MVRNRMRFSGLLMPMLIIAFLGVLIGCSTGGLDETPATTVTDPDTPVVIPAASIELLVSSNQLESDINGVPTVTLTAIVKDSSNRALSGKEVSFYADSGLLAVTKGTTDDTGKASATLSSGGNVENRVIHLTASTGAVSATNTVNVIGTNLSISGAASLSLGDSTPLTIFLKDSKGNGISGKTVTVTSSKGNTLSAANSVTNASGQVTVNVTAAAGGDDTIRASSIGAVKDYSLTVNTNILRFITPPPASVTEVPIATNQSITVEYVSGTTAQAGVTVNFMTTRGTLSSTMATTGADGRASVSVASTNSGPALLVAAVAGGPTTQTSIEFVAPTPVKMDIQASPNVIGPNSGGLTNERSLITVTVRDINDNLVKNQTVTFTILNDVSGGSLTPASAITDSYGTASTYFISGASSGGQDGVTIRAVVMGTAVMTTTTLTVAKKALFISLATGPEILKIDPNKYQKDYVALVSDSAGNPVVGATVVATVTPVYYKKGYFARHYEGIIFKYWYTVNTLDPISSTLPETPEGGPACANEDGMLHNVLYDYNGVLDSGEDQNGNYRLDPGNIASVTAATTGADGHATVSIVYARDYAHWVNVKLEAFANDLKGSTASAYTTFDLPGAAVDYNNENVTPPGYISPFGQSKSCYADLIVTVLSSSEISISWQQSPAAAHYHVYRNGINIADTNSNIYFDKGLASGTSYCYQIKTVNILGVETESTNIICATTFVLPPSGINVTPLSSSRMQISWTAASGASGYYVYRDGTLLTTVYTSTSFVDTGLQSDTTYCYAVSTLSAAGESAKTSQMCATTQAAGLSAPTGLTAVGTAGPPARVILTWTASEGAVSYRIYRDGNLISPVFAGSQATDNNVAAQTWYCYTISVVDGVGRASDPSSAVCVSTGEVELPTPTNLKATGSYAPMRVTLTWTASPGAASYHIYRDGSRIYPAFEGSQAIDTSGLTPDVWYCYAIAAVNSLGDESSPSTAVCMSIETPAAPSTPTGLTAALVGTTTNVTLTWNASSGAVQYYIYRNGTGPIATPSSSPYTDTTMKSSSTAYCYTISAVNSIGLESDESGTACVTTPPP